MDNKVYIIKCLNYQEADHKLAQLMAAMGGMKQFAKPGEKIVLKVNLLQAAKPEQAVTTHPAVMAAVARLAKAEGAVPIVADSPGSGYAYDKKSLEKTYRVSGMKKAAQDMGAELNLDDTYDSVFFREGKLIKRFEIISAIRNADAVFNLCKLKTHLFMHFTGAVKNLFGVIPGLTKPGYHAKLHDKNKFANMLLDLAAYVSPRLSIMDGIIGLEGEGPGAAGEPRHVGVLLASRNPLALDVVACEIIGLDRKHNPLLIEAEKRGLHPNRIEDVEVIGPDLAEFRVKDYKFPATFFEGAGMGGLSWWQKALSPLFKTGMTLKPVVNPKKCTACGVCRDACPEDAITIIEKNHAHINRDLCIRCYCCHEMCQYSAIDLQKSMLYRVINRNS